MQMPESLNKTACLLPGRYYGLLLEPMRMAGASSADIQIRTGIDPASLHLPDTLLKLDQVDSLIEAAVAATGNEHLGFEIGRMIKPSNHELLGYALMTSATLDEALRMATRYWRLITPIFTLRYERTTKGVQIKVEPALHLKPLTLRFHIEAIATAIHAELGFLLSKPVPSYDLHVPESVTNAACQYRQLAPARIHFDAVHRSGLQFDLPAGMIARPLALADPNALKIARQRCDDALSHLARFGSLGEWLTMMLDQAQDHQPRQQELARILHLSTRTMNRRLGGEGIRYRELGRRSRHRRACRLLSETTLSITRIALQLGYQEAANFSRAFRRAEGVSPTEFRSRFKI